MKKIQSKFQEDDSEETSTMDAKRKLDFPEESFIDGDEEEDDKRSVHSIVSNRSIIQDHSGFLALLDNQFDVTKHVREFDGQNVADFAKWKRDWKICDAKFAKFERPLGERYLEMRRVLKGHALELVDHFEGLEGDYEKAQAILEQVYGQKKDVLKVRVDKLMDMEPIKHNKEDVTKLFASVTGIIETFKSNNLSAEEMLMVCLVAMAERRMSIPLKREWTKLYNNKKNPENPIGSDINLKVLSNFLLNQVPLTEKKADKKLMEEKFKKKDKKEPPKLKTTMAFTSKFKQQPTRGDNYVCFKCLQPWKGAEEHKGKCTNLDVQCNICQRNHDTSQHEIAAIVFRGRRQRDENRKPSGAEKETKREIEVKEAKTFVTKENDIMSHTCVANLVAKNGKKVRVRAMLDNQSGKHLVQKKSAKQIGLRGQKVDLKVEVVGKNEHTFHDGEEVEFSLESLDGKFLSEPIKAITVDHISSNINIPVNPKQYEHLKDLEFSEPKLPIMDAEINVLIGEPLYSYLIEPEMRKPPTMNLPGGIKSKLGWLITGTVPRENKIFRVSVLEKTVAKFDALEAIGITEPKDPDYTLDEAEAKEMMDKVTEFDEKQGKYVTDLLFKEDPKDLDVNYDRAVKTMLNVERTTTDPEIMNLTIKAFNQLVEDKYAEKVPEDELKLEKGKTHVLEAFPVVDLERQTTKVRVCMNAGRRGQNGKSLNDYVYCGKNLIPLVTDVLLNGGQRGKW